jgi:methylenetetrahydrofolate reductase (NADPH)
MNTGVLLSGLEMRCQPRFLIGAAANPFAEPLEMRVIRLQKKIGAGARFIQTQPVFEPEIFGRWLRRIVEEGLHGKAAILPGIMPVRSAKSLLWMRDNLPGMRVHPDYIRRMAEASDPQQEGLALAVELIHSLRGMTGVHGIHIMPSLWEGVVPALLSEAGLVP